MEDDSNKTERSGNRGQRKVPGYVPLTIHNIEKDKKGKSGKREKPYHETLGIDERIAKLNSSFGFKKGPGEANGNH